MEKPPAPVIETEINEELSVIATELQATLLDIFNGKKDISEAEEDLESVEKAFQELRALFDESDVEEKRKLEEIERRHATSIQGLRKTADILKVIISELETTYEKQMRSFETMKALQREATFGISGTAH